MARAERQPFHVYRVGGSVRDELIGREHGDRDWVVVGATPEMMTASGYKPVGSDFPVFLHPDTREEYALARTERKTGPGYRGFWPSAQAAFRLRAGRLGILCLRR